MRLLNDKGECMINVLTYLEEEYLAPKGGPYAVGYYIYSNAKNDNTINIEFIKYVSHINQLGGLIL